jgi:succinyl-CoA synthetase beta subunit
MNIHEYQAKALLARYGVAILKGGVAATPAEAAEVAAGLGGPVYVVKAQIHAGGRGKGRFAGDPSGKGGVRVTRSVDSVRAEAEAMLGATLVTEQTGAQGKCVQRLYVEEGCDIERELYLSFLVDRKSGRVTVIASTEGGMSIEQVAAEMPDRIKTVTVDPTSGWSPFHARRIAYGLGLAGTQISTAIKFLGGVYRAFTELDCSLIEINPLVVTRGGTLIALDAKISFDDNALFRHAEIAQLRDESEQDPIEIEAERAELNYVKLDGNIGCMVNGAGLAMATMDIIKLSGGEPANFLDVGGGATRARVATAFKLILSDPNVKGILVNIFGGIMRCDVIAEGVVAAARDVGLAVPLVVRLEGTNVERGKEILADSGLPLISASNLGDAAEKIVSAVKRAA